jgi:septum formation protein
MLVLASASPRRQELLHNAGMSFTVQPANVDETPIPGESARDCAERLAREKALAVWRTRPQELILGADTVVVIGTEILGKPSDFEDAARMLRLLSARQHQVITGVALVSARSASRNIEPRIEVSSETTMVTMNELSETEIRDYVHSGEPMDKAGGYAIQGIASRWIPRIEGDYSNVVGLPIALVYRMLRASNGGTRWDE